MILRISLYALHVNTNNTSRQLATIKPYNKEEQETKQTTITLRPTPINTTPTRDNGHAALFKKYVKKGSVNQQQQQQQQHHQKQQSKKFWTGPFAQTPWEPELLSGPRARARALNPPNLLSKRRARARARTQVKLIISDISGFGFRLESRPRIISHMTQSSCGESPGELPNSHDEPAARVSKERHFAHHFIPPDPLMNYCTDLLVHFVHSSPNLTYPTHHLFRVGLVLHIPKGRTLEPCIWMAHARKNKGNTQASNQPTNAKYLTALKNAKWSQHNPWCSLFLWAKVSMKYL